MNITERGPTTVTIAFAANELLAMVNALQSPSAATDADDVDAYRRLQRPLVEALRTLRPKAHLSESTGRWMTDWPRGEEGKHL